MLVAHLSDPHIAEPGRGPDGLFATGRHLAAAIQHIRTLPVPPDALIISGDLVDAGAPAEYMLLRELLAPLPMPVYLIPGNHDHADGLREAFADWGYFPEMGQLYYTVEQFPVRLVLLDSSIPGQVHGELGVAQLRWLDDRLGEQSQRPTLVVLHHPPFDSGIRRMDLWKLADADALEAVVRRHPQVERVVCGHLHRSMVRRFGGTVVQSCPSTAQQLALDLLDPGTSLTVKMEPPAALLHAWDGHSLITHQIVLQDPGVAQKIAFPAAIQGDTP